MIGVADGMEHLSQIGVSGGGGEVGGNIGKMRQEFALDFFVYGMGMMAVFGPKSSGNEFVECRLIHGGTAEADNVEIGW